MQDLIAEAISRAENLEQIYREVVSLLATINRHRGRVGYVAGIITSDGAQHIDRNLRLLSNHTQTLDAQHNFPIISAPLIFDKFLIARLEGQGAKNEDFMHFWRSILASGHITDIFFTPRWQESAGAQDEFETAKRLGLRIHYII